MRVFVPESAATLGGSPSLGEVSEAMWAHGSRGEGELSPPSAPPLHLPVRNTFFALSAERPDSLESVASSDFEMWPAAVLVGTGTIKHAAYSPGEQLVRSAALAVSTPHAEAVALDGDARSECSTADTQGRTPPSPVMEPPLKPLTIDEGTAGAAASGIMPPMPSPWPGSVSPEELPSLGSALHRTGQCKPCAFQNTKGCISGSECHFCHICEPGEKKRRQKEKRAFFSTVRRFQKETSTSWPFGPVPIA